MRVCVCVYGLLPDSNKDLIWFDLAIVGSKIAKSREIQINLTL